MTIPTFDIDIFFEQDANAIFNARSNAIAMHKTKNIDAAGDEVELPVKEIIRKRLPGHYYVGQGHIVDSELRTSGQFDILVGDNKGSPILFSSQNSTDYLTFESIYAFGEIKSTFYKSKNYISEFIKKIATVNNQLKRQPTPKEQLTQDISLKVNGQMSITSSDNRPYKNPLFKFMFFVDHGDLIVKDVIDILNSTTNVNCPNLICFLNKGVFLKARGQKTIDDIPPVDQNKITDPAYQKEMLDIIRNSMKWNFQSGELFPEFIANENDGNYRWVFIDFQEEKNSASVLSFLIYSLNVQLNSCMLLKPNLLQYHNKLFRIKSCSSS